MKDNPHVGSSLDELLAEDGTLAEIDTVAIKRALAWQIARAMKERRLTKSAMAREMRTSRSAIDRLLDPEKPSVTLQTLDRAAKVLGKRLRIELVDGA